MAVINGIDGEVYQLEDNKEVCTKAKAMTYEQLQKLQIHEEITNKIHKLYETKNMDYGDSMHPLFEEYGLTAFLIMFEIKLNRIKSLQYKGGRGHYESLQDSIMDLANYAIIALTEIEYRDRNTKMEGK